MENFQTRLFKELQNPVPDQSTINIITNELNRYERNRIATRIQHLQDLLNDHNLSQDHRRRYLAVFDFLTGMRRHKYLPKVSDSNLKFIPKIKEQLKQQKTKKDKGEEQPQATVDQRGFRFTFCHLLGKSSHQSQSFGRGGTIDDDLLTAIGAGSSSVLSGLLAAIDKRAFRET